MRFGHLQHRPRRNLQDGYILLVLMLMAALIIVGLTAELPAIGVQIRRDREQELIHRGAQYARAIKHYYVKFRSYPVRIEQLENTNNIRFLRKKYKDPMTGEDFRLLHFGDLQLSNKQPGSATGPGIGVGSGVAAPGAGGQIVGQTPFGGAAQQPFGGAAGQQPFGSTGQQPFGGAAGQQPFGSASGSLTRPVGQGQTFGGGPIIGVASTSEKKSLHVFNEKDHYNDWEFIYDPTQDRGGLIRGPYNGNQAVGGGTIPGAVTPGQMNQGQPGGPFQQPFGQPFGGGGRGGMQNPPQQPPQPQPPQ